MNGICPHNDGFRSGRTRSGACAAANAVLVIYNGIEYITFIDNAVNTATGTITIKGTFANREKRLVPGQFVTVVLLLATQPDAILVPTQSVEQGQEGQYVYVIKSDSTVEMRPVTAAQDIQGETVILKGIKAGERVVTDGQMQLVPGAKVTVKVSK